MSYCRLSCDDFKSDVYVYRHVQGGFDIHCTERKPKHVDTAQECLDRLLKYREDGLHIPEHAIERLRGDIEREQGRETA